MYTTYRQIACMSGCRDDRSCHPSLDNIAIVLLLLSHGTAEGYLSKHNVVLQHQNAMSPDLNPSNVCFRYLMPSLQPYGGKGWTLACLLPPSSISLYANILLKLESAQSGISRQTLHLSVNSQSPFSAATVFKMLLLDVVLYACLTWYFDQVQCSGGWHGLYKCM